MNDKQIADVKHALRNGNRFYTSANDTNWNDLVAKGFATKRPGWEDDMAYYIVTSEGERELLDDVKGDGDNNETA